MNTTIVIYGSSTGTCEAIAEKIASKLGCEAINVQDLTADIVAANQNLILGTSTWGAGELQDDWYDGLKTLQGADLSGKTIALFGCGDCSTYSDTFVGGMGELYNGMIQRPSSTASSSACPSMISTRTTRPIPASRHGLPPSLLPCNHR